MFIAIGLMGLTAGVWIDSWAKNFDSARPSKAKVKEMENQTLAGDLLSLASNIEIFSGNTFLYAERLPQIYSEIAVMMTRLANDGYRLPVLSRNAEMTDKFTFAARYFRFIVPLIRAGHIKSAQEFGRSLDQNVIQGEAHSPP